MVPVVALAFQLYVRAILTFVASDKFGWQRACKHLAPCLPSLFVVLCATINHAEQCPIAQEASATECSTNMQKLAKSLKEGCFAKKLGHELVN